MNACVLRWFFGNMRDGYVFRYRCPYTRQYLERMGVPCVVTVVVGIGALIVSYPFGFWFFTGVSILVAMAFGLVAVVLYAAVLIMMVEDLFRPPDITFGGNG